MESPSVRALWNHAVAGFARLLVGLSCLGFVSAQALTITVRGTDGTTVNAYRYTIEEDTTFDVVPDVTGLAGDLPLGPTLHGAPGAPPEGTDMKQFKVVVPMRPDERKQLPQGASEGEQRKRRG